MKPLNSILLFLKGIAMGAANVIPGVSGGTIAFITGIYEPFIASLKSFDGKAINHLVHFRFKQLALHINFQFLLVLGLGILVSLFTIGKLLDYLFINYPVYVWSFFFGLIAISIKSVGTNISKWTLPVYTSFAIGTGIAVLLAFLTPASESDATVYLILCGAVAMASMILPGLSGSFVLILMGNYQLIMLQAIPGLHLHVIIPVGIGAVLGFVVLSRAIHFLMEKHQDKTIAILTGFILGSLLIIWPWKSEVHLLSEGGLPIIKNGKELVSGYQWFMPELSSQTLYALILMVLGVGLVNVIERLSKIKK